jgi:hypothetical protein
MSKVVLMDANNLALRCVHSKDVIAYKPDKTVDTIDYDYWKYLMFNSIYMSLFAIKNVGTVVFAMDDSNSWRYDVWPRYKEDRKLKKKKDKSEFPWDQFFEEFNAFREDITKHLPIKVMKISKCEGDDIIGVVTMKETRPCEIISTDKDFLQLCSDRVKVYNPIKKCHVSHPNTTMFLLEQCLRGQSKDSIFNIKTPLDFPVGKRKPGFGPKAFEKVIEYGPKQWLLDNDLVERYKFNKVLMDFNCIPQSIQDTIWDEYTSYEYPEPDMIWKFVKEKGYPEVIENFTNIEQRFMELY